MIFYGVDSYFSWHKGDPEIFLRSEGGGAKKIWDKIFLYQAPLTSVCEQSLNYFHHTFKGKWVGSIFKLSYFLPVLLYYHRAFQR